MLRNPSFRYPAMAIAALVAWAAVEPFIVDSNFYREEDDYLDYILFGSVAASVGLFLGAAETTIGIDDNYERVAAGRTSAYRVRTGAPAGAARRG